MLATLLPLELLEKIGQNTDVKTYHALRAACRTALKLRPVPQLTLPALKKSIAIWKAWKAASNSDEEPSLKLNLDGSHLDVNGWSFLVRYGMTREFLRHFAKHGKDLSWDIKQLLMGIATGGMYDEKIISVTLDLDFLYHREIVNALVRSPGDWNRREICILASVQNDLTVFSFLAPDIVADNTNLIQSLLHFTAARGFEEISLFMLSFPCVDPSQDDNATLAFACKGGNEKIIKVLLEDTRVRPNTFCFMGAVSSGHLNVLQMLLEDGRQAPGDHDNATLSCAIQFQRVEMVAMLLKDPRIDPSLQENHMLECAVSIGNAEIVRLILADSRVKPSGFLQLAAVKLLLHATA
ncbi:hypothetical protein HDV03_001460 [Kappamyces sp. JEL0829]|nr:hypothetical protein HDV03_001460 [Kappamyces sp. JEL0829]